MFVHVLSALGAGDQAVVYLLELLLLQVVHLRGQRADGLVPGGLAARKTVVPQRIERERHAADYDGVDD